MCFAHNLKISDVIKRRSIWTHQYVTRKKKRKKELWPHTYTLLEWWRFFTSDFNFYLPWDKIFFVWCGDLGPSYIFFFFVFVTMLFAAVTASTIGVFFFYVPQSHHEDKITHNSFLLIRHQSFLFIFLLVCSLTSSHS